MPMIVDDFFLSDTKKARVAKQPGLFPSRSDYRFLLASALIALPLALPFKVVVRAKVLTA